MSSNDAFFQRCRGLLSRLVSNAEYFFVAAAEFPVAPPVDGPIKNRINYARRSKWDHLLHDGSVRLDFMTGDLNEAEEMLWDNICGLLSSSLSP